MRLRKDKINEQLLCGRTNECPACGKMYLLWGCTGHVRKGGCINCLVEIRVSRLGEGRPIVTITREGER